MRVILLAVLVWWLVRELVMPWVRYRRWQKEHPNWKEYE